MTTPLRILFFDVETKPVKCWLWRTGPKVFVSHDQVVAGERFDIICICYKWLGSRETHTLDWGLHAQDSSQMIAKFAKIAESADLVIGHNADNFDIKQINTQRLLHGQPPISWPTSDDTLKAFRKHFYFPNYKLDYISKLLTGSGKDPMNFQDWINIVDKKDRKALDKMIRYCKRDVTKLEKIYRQAAPFFTAKANASIASFGDRRGCPRCASTDAMKTGSKLTGAGKYQRFMCRKCNHIYLGGKRLA